jgi:protein-disulfide isomerase
VTTTRRPFTTALALMLAVVTISALVALIPRAPEIVEGTAVAAAVLGDRGSPAFGPADADVTVVDFSDYQCGPCKQGEPAFEKAIAADGRVRVIYKDWAALGPVSKTEAEIALAAQRQGRYLAVHRALMRSTTRGSPETLRTLVVGAGVDWVRLTSDLARDKHAIDVQLSRHAFQAWSLGLQGPPAYLVGPYLIRGRLSEGDLRGLIRKARRHHPAKAS